MVAGAGSAEQEDISFKQMVADYEKASGNTIDYSILPFAPMRQEIAAITSGVVPDIINLGDYFFGVLGAWKDQLVDLTDVIETQKSLFTPSSLSYGYAYNNVAKKRSYYILPLKAAVTPFHTWKSLIETAGYKTSDIPKTWDAFLDFFPQVAAKLRAQGRRNIYGYSIQISAAGFDVVGQFDHVMIAYGGKDLFTSDGKVHTNDPQAREAVIKAVEQLTTAYKKGDMPSAMLNWNDADDNKRLSRQNDHHGSRRHDLDRGGALGQQGAVQRHPDLGLPLSNDGKALPSVPGQGVVVPKAPRNIEAARIA